MRVSLIFLLLFACTCPANGQTPADLRSQSKRDLRNHSRWYIRTPDGVVWDMWGEQRYLKVFNTVVKKKSTKKQQSLKGFIKPLPAGKIWVVDESRESRAWDILGHVVGNQPPRAPSYYARSYEGLPPLWRTIDGNIQPNFIYINERSRDVVSRGNEEHSTKVTHDLGDNLFSVDVNQGRGMQSTLFASRRNGKFLVYVEDPEEAIKNDHLAGEFILWSDASIVAPPEVEGFTYRYLPVDELRLTKDGLGEAVYQGDAELVSWEYKRNGTFWRWTRRVHPLKYLDPEAIRLERDAAKKRAAEQPPAPVLEPTHLLILVGNHYHYGRLISESESEVRFLVINGSMTAESVFPRDQIVILKEVTPPPPPPLDPER